MVFSGLALSRAPVDSGSQLLAALGRRHRSTPRRGIPPHTYRCFEQLIETRRELSKCFQTAELGGTHHMPVHINASPKDAHIDLGALRPFRITP